MSNSQLNTTKMKLFNLIYIPLLALMILFSCQKEEKSEK